MARRILAVLLLAMAAGQLRNVPAFVDIVETYDAGDRSAAWALSLGLVVGEIIGGVGLLLRSVAARWVAALVAVGVTLAWSALAVQAFARGLVVDNCGCFGVYLAQELRWWVLVQDVYFIVLAVWVARDVRRDAHRTSRDLARSISR